MTIETTANIVRYSGNGATTVFSYTFLIPTATDVVVTYTDVAGADHTLSSTQYTITGLGDPNGGTVTVLWNGAAIIAGTRLTIARVLPVVQETDLTNQDGFYPETVEDALDYLTMLIQQFEGELDNVIRVPLSDPTPSTLPAAAARALKSFIFDASGNPSVGLPSGVANISAAMQPVVAAASLAAARIAMGVNVVMLKGTYGAVGNGVANDTSALASANTDGAFLLVEPGTYLIDNIVLNNLEGMIALGEVNFIPSGSVPTGGTQSFFMLFTNPTVYVQGIKITASKATYPNLYGLCAAAPAAEVIFLDNSVVGCGFAIYGANVVNLSIIRNTVSAYALRGINCDGASQGNVSILFNSVNGSGSTVHGITGQFGAQVAAIGNYITEAGFFGIGFNGMAEVTIALNRIFNSVHESWNIEDCSVFNISNNVSYWDTTVSTDYGGSIFGNTASNAYGAVLGNVLVNAGAAGIGVEGPATGGITGVVISDNVVLNSGRAGATSAIKLSGSSCVKNYVHHNMLINSIAAMTYGVEEVDPGTGLPVFNRIENNFVEGFTTKQVLHVNALAPTILGANTDNWAPTSFAYYDIIHASASAGFDLTGIAGGFAGCRKTIYNSGAQTITLKNNATSSAGNRFFLGADFSLTAGIAISITWDSVINGWIRD